MTDESGPDSKAIFVRKAREWSLNYIPGIILFLGIWESYSWLVDEPVFIPSLSRLASRTYEVTLEHNGYSACVLCIHAMYTFGRLFAGMAIASVIGIPVGIGIARNLWIRRLITPTLRFLLPIPALLVTLFIVFLLGSFNKNAVIYSAAIVAILPIISATWDGVMTVSPRLAYSAQPTDRPETTSFWNTIFPASLPSIISGVRIGLSRARSAVVAGELLTTKIVWGLGSVVFEAREELDTSFVIVSIAGFSLLALLIEKLIIQTIERATVIKWGIKEARITNPSYTFY